MIWSWNHFYKQKKKIFKEAKHFQKFIFIKKWLKNVMYSDNYKHLS
jgi:hypothetical protein